MIQVKCQVCGEIYFWPAVQPKEFPFPECPECGSLEYEVGW